jgi:putative oxidoreductase
MSAAPWRERLRSPWLTDRTAFVLAAFFVVAGVAKIVDPPDFAHEVHNYALLPDGAVNALALVLPWVEVVSGVFLFLGIWRRTSAALLGVLLITFTAALSVNLARRRPVDCGCFGGAAKTRTDEERLRDMKLAVARDAGLLALAAQIVVADSRRERKIVPARRPSSQEKEPVP